MDDADFRAQALRFGQVNIVSEEACDKFSLQTFVVDRMGYRVNFTLDELLDELERRGHRPRTHRP